MKRIICDIDNCVANDEWRIPFINWSQTKDMDARYHVYHTLGIGDEAAGMWLMDAMDAMQVEHVHFFTSRGLRYNKITHWWLEDKFGWKRGQHYTLHMRNNADHRSSVEIKREMLAGLFSHTDIMPDDISAAYDDREDIVDMYRHCGIKSYVRAVHNKCAWTAPVPKRDPETVPEILRAGADTYEARNAVYGDNYKRVGEVMAALFPQGLTLRTAEQFNQWHLFELMVVKMTRFTNSKLEHADSIHDLQVYAAMVQSLIKKGTFE